jgi:large subunit ribosomal protein L15
MLNSIRPTSPRKDEKRIGRGGKRGKTSGRGTKGQWAHGGHGVRPEIRDMIKKIPKLRGRGISPNKPVSPKPITINISRLDALFNAKDVVSPATLVEKGYVRAHQAAKNDIKLLANGEVTKALSVTGLVVSAASRAKIEAAGGSVA